MAWKQYDPARRDRILAMLAASAAADAATNPPADPRRLPVVHAYAHSIIADILTDVALGAEVPPIGTVLTGDYGFQFEETFIEGHFPDWSSGSNGSVRADALALAVRWLAEGR